MIRKAQPPDIHWPTLQEFIDYGGQLKIGRFHPVRCIAVAANEDGTCATLVRRDGESLVELLHRLDQAIDKALNEEIFTNELDD